MATQWFECIFFLLLYKITLLKVKQRHKMKTILSPLVQLKLFLYHFWANFLHRIAYNMFRLCMGTVLLWDAFSSMVLKPYSRMSQGFLEWSLGQSSSKMPSKWNCCLSCCSPQLPVIMCLSILINPFHILIGEEIFSNAKWDSCCQQCLDFPCKWLQLSQEPHLALIKHNSQIPIDFSGRWHGTQWLELVSSCAKSSAVIGVSGEQRECQAANS